MPQVEIFTPTGVVAGITPRPGLVASPDLRSPVQIDGARWYPLDGSKPEHRGTVLIPPDDVLVVVAQDRDMTIHATWYDLVLDMGPYRVFGRMGTPPGFDPARALVRPGGAFVALRDGRIELMNRAGAGVAERASIHVSRYAVERVESTLMLGYFFPGAQLTAPPTEATVA
jgi:hypothetical protein